MGTATILSIADISEQLGVHPYTVRRWISNGKLKASKDTNRSGYKVTIRDFEEFVNNNPTYNYFVKMNKTYCGVKENVLKDLMIELYRIQAQFLSEDHGKVYSEGWNAAMEKFNKLMKDNLVEVI